MYETYWGLARAPFQNVPDPAFFCPIRDHGEILDRFQYVVRCGKGGALLIGEVGCGKSMLSRVLLLRLGDERYDVGLVINPSLPSDDLLCDIARELGLSVPAPRRATLFRPLNQHLLANAEAGKTTVLVIDEAHTITDDAVFEDLRMLMNFQLNDRQLLSVIFIGLPELGGMIAQRVALQQRLALRLNLGPLSERDTGFYIDFRVSKAGGKGRIFTAEAVREIYREAGGIPRRINTLCDLCLLEGARRRASEVEPGLVRQVLALV